MLRIIAAFVAGFLTFIVIVSLIQVVNGLIFGMPDPETLSNPDAMREFVSKMPAGAFAILLAGYAAGSFAAGFLMRLISRSGSLVLPLIIGAIGTLGWIVNVISIPHPLWLTAVGLLMYIPFAVLGHMAAAKAVPAA